MTRLPDDSISFQNTVGDSGIENLYVYGKFNYNFKDDDINQIMKMYSKECKNFFFCFKSKITG